MYDQQLVGELNLNSARIDGDPIDTRSTVSRTLLIKTSYDSGI